MGVHVLNLAKTGQELLEEIANRHTLTNFLCTCTEIGPVRNHSSL